MKTTLLRIIFLLVISLPLSSQEYYPHGLAIGINGAVVSDGFSSGVTNKSLGLHFDHQRNWARFFAFRTSIDLNYLLPDEDESLYQSGTSITKVKTIESGLNTSLNLEPLFYMRSDVASVYVGLGVVAGDHAYYRKRVTHYPDNTERTNKYKDNYFFVGIKPSIGVTFHMRDSKDDIDFQFSQNILGPLEYVIDDGLFDNSEVMYVLTVAYRFNFLKG